MGRYVTEPARVADTLVPQDRQCLFNTKVVVKPFHPRSCRQSGEEYIKYLSRALCCECVMPVRVSTL